MSHTAIYSHVNESSRVKKPGLLKVEGLLKGHYIKVVIDQQEGCDSDGEFETIIKISDVKKENDYILVYTDDICVDALTLYCGTFYKRYSQKYIDKNCTKSYGTGYHKK